jgi:hypothetical protein
MAPTPQQQLTLALPSDQRADVELALTLPDATSPHALGARRTSACWA